MKNKILGILALLGVVALVASLSLGGPRQAEAQNNNQSDLFASAQGLVGASTALTVTVQAGTTGYTIVPKYIVVSSSVAGYVTFTGSVSGHTVLIAPVTTSVPTILDANFCNGVFGLVGTGSGAMAKGDSLLAAPQGSGTVYVAMRYESR